MRGLKALDTETPQPFEHYHPFAFAALGHHRGRHASCVGWCCPTVAARSDPEGRRRESNGVFDNLETFSSMSSAVTVFTNSVIKTISERRTNRPVSSLRFSVRLVQRAESNSATRRCKHRNQSIPPTGSAAIAGSPNQSRQRLTRSYRTLTKHMAQQQAGIDGVIGFSIPGQRLAHEMSRSTNARMIW